MINFVKTISSSFDKKKRAIIKYLRLGNNDVQTSPQAASYGIDSRPVKNMVAVYLTTSEKGKNVIVGYVNENLLADVGENRLYSTDASGNLKAFAWLKNDGTIELNGSTHNIIRFTPLDTAQQKLAVDINNELVKIAAGIATAGGSYTPTPISIDISAAKNNIIKTN